MRDVHNRSTETGVKTGTLKDSEAVVWVLWEEETIKKDSKSEKSYYNITTGIENNVNIAEN